MKTPSHELFDMVQAMSQSEKRYFMLSPAGQDAGGHSYIGFFKQLNQMEEYDEELLRKKFSTLSNGSFKKLKHYTAKSIARSLEAFHAHSSAEIIVLRKLIQAEIYFDKKLFSLCSKAVDSALQLAEQYNLYFLQLHCLAWQYKVNVASVNASRALEVIDVEKSGLLLNLAAMFLELKRLNARFWNVIYTRHEVGKEEKKEFKSIITRVRQLERSAPGGGYFVNKEIYLLLGLCYRFYGDAENSYLYRKKLVQHNETYGELKNERAAEYLTSLGNLMNACLDLGKSLEMRRTFVKVRAFMKQLPKKYFSARLDERYCNLFNSYISFLLQEKKYSEVLGSGTELLNRLRKHNRVFQNSLYSILYINLCYAAFYTADIKTSMRYYRQARKYFDGTSIKKRLFALVLYFEAGDLDALHYECRSIQYFLQKENRTSGYEMLLTRSFLNRIPKRYNSLQISEEFGRLYKELLPFKQELQEGTTDKGFDFLSWARQKSLR